MRRILFLITVAVLGLMRLPSAYSEMPAADLRLGPGDRVLIVAPHPDDETLGCAGLIQTALEAGASVKVAYLTSGESNEISSITYQIKPLIIKSDFLKNGRMRKKEAIEAMALLGLSRDNLIFIGYPDLGTLKIWEKHWGNVKPYRGLISRINKVLDQDDVAYGHYHKGEFIVQDCEAILSDYKPTHVFVTSSFDLHMDHQAAYLFVKTAFLNLTGKLVPMPRLHLYLIHSRRWPSPKKLAINRPLLPPLYLGAMNWKSLPLSAQMTSRKKEAILRYRTQTAYSRSFLLSFARQNELYIDDPEPLRVVLRPQAGRAAADFADDASAADYVLSEKTLRINIPLKERLEQMGALTSDIYCYGFGKDFGQMPKISLRFFGSALTVKDGSRTLRKSGITYEIEGNHVVVKIPVALLKNPDHLFVSTRTAKEVVTPGFGAWRLLRITSKN